MRLNKLKKNLKKNGQYPYLVSNLTNINYLTGFDGSYGFLLIDDKDTFFITDSRYTEYAESILGSIEVIQQKGDITDSIKNILSGIKKKKLYIEQTLPYENYLSYKNKLKNIKVLPIQDEVAVLRIIKDENELNTIRRAVAMTDSCFNHLLKIIRPGITEWDVSVEIEYFYRKNGCRRSSFDSIIASGKNSSMPHYIPSMSKKIENNDILLIDMGCVYNGYNSDLTRTVFVGSIDEEFKKIYNIVKRAQEEAISSVKSGLSCGALDKIARDVISKEGYGPLFGHSLGHGLGLEIHESPYMRKQNTYKLKAGIPFTIEPGIYLPDKGGVRIEDVVVATKNGYENLTTASKDIIIL